MTFLDRIRRISGPSVLARRPAQKVWPHARRPVREPVAGQLPYAYGSNALTAALAALGLGQGARLLVPDFLCDIVPATLEALGVIPVHYPLDDELCPDLDTLRELCPSADALLAVHFFGQPQNVHDLGDLAASFGLPLIEDNAHGYGAEVDGQPLGAFGAAGFCSPWKQLGIPHGALLRLAPGLTAKHPPDSTPPTQGIKAQFRATGLGLVRRVLPGVDGLKPMPDYADPRLEPSSARPMGAMDETVAAYLASVDPAAMAVARRAVYAVWEEFAAYLGLRPLFRACHSGASPLCFAAYAQNAAQTARLHAFGHVHGLGFFSWPTLPKSVVTPGSPALDRFLRMLCMPIHQDMDPTDLRARLIPLVAKAPGVRHAPARR